MLIAIEKARQRLAIIWFAGGGILFTLIFLLTTIGIHRGISRDVWTWFLPTVIPTLSLISGILVSDIMYNDPERKVGKRLVYRIALTLSIVYMAIIGFIVLVHLIDHNISLLELMKNSAFALGALQGLLSAFIGAFFYKSEKESA